MAENYILFLSSVFLLFGLILTQEFAGSPKYKMPEVCKGSSEGLSASGKDENRYLKLKKIYENCTYVDGNLEIKFLEGSSKNYDLSFLSHIEEVSGYVIIASLHTKYIPLPNLKIIRGNKLFHYKGGYYSLFVALNHRKGTTDVGLHELQLTSLAEITRGDVYFSGNDLLCFHDTILWKDIKFDPKYKVKISLNNTQTERRKCGECDEKCLSTYDNNRHCWGRGPDMCQKFTRVTCHAGCDAGCFGPAPSQCCHPQCAAGCTGPRSTDCVVCKNFYNEGKCVSECPKPFEYNRQSMRIEENPEGKYSYGSTCVKECPEHMSKDTVNFHCVYSCPDDFHSVNGTCVKCERQCPKRCPGHDTKSIGRQYLTSKNIHEFENCTVVDGNLMIVEASFNGDSYRNISGITFDQLSILKSVREIKGHLAIQSNHPKMKDLSFLSNLEVIHGRELDVGGNAFTVIVTLARSLEMISLKKVENGKISIWGNKNLCFLKGTNFSRLLKTTGQKVELTKNKDYRDCRQEGEVCDPSCSNDGCWGKGPNKCLECRTYRIDNSSNICIESCDAVPLLYDAGGRRCRFCHTECVSACTGPEPTDCDKCRNYMVYSTKIEKDGSRNRTCLKQCPDDYYSDSRNVCYPCHNDCKNGCTGPSNVVGKGGCNTCELGVERKDAFGNSTYTCSPFADQDGVRCPNTHFEIRVGVNVKNNPLRGESACLLCHELCDGCIQDGPSNCKKCRYVNQDSICLKQCYSLSYSDDNNICRPCHKECLGECHGATNSDCKACKNFKIYLNADMSNHLLSSNCTGNGCQLFNCTEECPSTMTYRVKDYMSAEEGLTVCADESHPEVRKMIEDKDEANKQKIIIIICSCLGGIVVLAAALTLFGYLWRQRARSQEKTAILTAKMTGYDDEQPVTPTDAKPDMSNLRLIKESELRRGGIIGSGAFGTVYKGFWIPNNENVKIPVAIKVLQEGTSPNQNKELLEEARVMASVEHMCCIRILAVCMTAQMMLITQLMPLGCLLDYVRKHKDNIGSKVLLNWCTQIAKGMGYLEERGIVHRDLAARNVLVQSPGQIKITDFGLAKLLDYNEEEYHAAGGKMPIKWLALECIQHRIFTHKSDVWSYGVTVWELFTYGQRPYENVRAKDVPDLLEKGERLPQPNICTIDVYMIMIKCWMLDADSRPSFIELSEEFAKMARDPGRYLVISGDELKKIAEDSNTPSQIDQISPDLSENPNVEGDKLMRLPSHSYDKNDLARSLSVAADGPEEVIEAEEYLQPTPRVSLEIPTTPVSSKTPLLQPYDAATNVNDIHLKEIHGPPRREKRYAHLDAAAKARQKRVAMDPRTRGDSINSRYSSDPVKILHGDETDFGPVDQQKKPLRNGSLGQADRIKNYSKHQPDMSMKLPVDEDDYLQPKSTKPRAYADLLNDQDYMNDSSGSVFLDDPSPRNYREPAMNFENPEYFDETNFNVPKQQIANRNYYNDMSKINGNATELRPLVNADDFNSETTV